MEHLYSLLGEEQKKKVNKNEDGTVHRTVPFCRNDTSVMIMVAGRGCGENHVLPAAFLSYMLVNKAGGQSDRGWQRP